MGSLGVRLGWGGFWSSFSSRNCRRNSQVRGSPRTRVGDPPRAVAPSCNVNARPAFRLKSTSRPRGRGARRSAEPRSRGHFKAPIQLAGSGYSQRRWALRPLRAAGGGSSRGGLPLRASSGPSSSSAVMRSSGGPNDGALRSTSSGCFLLPVLLLQIVGSD